MYHQLPQSSNILCSPMDVLRLESPLLRCYACVGCDYAGQDVPKFREPIEDVALSVGGKHRALARTAAQRASEVGVKNLRQALQAKLCSREYGRNCAAAPAGRW